jgi:hypothetical protein
MWRRGIYYKLISVSDGLTASIYSVEEEAHFFSLGMLASSLLRLAVSHSTTRNPILILYPRFAPPAYSSALKVDPETLLLRSPLSERMLGRQRTRWEHDIKMGLRYKYISVIPQKVQPHTSERFNSLPPYKGAIRVAYRWRPQHGGCHMHMSCFHLQQKIFCLQ